MFGCGGPHGPRGRQNLLCRVAFHRGAKILPCRVVIISAGKPTPATPARGGRRPSTPPAPVPPPRAPAAPRLPAPARPPHRRRPARRGPRPLSQQQPHHARQGQQGQGLLALGARLSPSGGMFRRWLHRWKNATQNATSGSLRRSCIFVMEATQAWPTWTGRSLGRVSGAARPPWSSDGPRRPSPVLTHFYGLRSLQGCICNQNGDNGGGGRCRTTRGWGRATWRP
jgi:hypothetical protein